MFKKIKQDIQRWVVPQSIADPSQVTLIRSLRLFMQHPSLRMMFWFRLGSWCKQKKIPFMAGFTQAWIHLFHGADLWVGNDYGGGLYIAHPVGSVIAAQKIGENCSIIANVTIGMRNEWAFPIIGDNVFIGAGARVLGSIQVGDGAVIGANVVVIRDVPAGATVVGVPAREIHAKSSPAGASDQETGA